MKISIIVPVYNEEEPIKGVITELQEYLKSKNIVNEIIIVNDGSTDNSLDILKNISGIKIINHPYNKGYGAALKTGARSAQYEWLLFFDSDGQHRAQHIKDLIDNKEGYDLVIGIRDKGSRGPLIRQPGKKILNLVANYLAEQKIPDLFSGFRLINKEKFLRLAHILSNSFSISTTTTLAFLKEGYNIKYVPISGRKRTGKSSLKITDGFKVMMLILRIMTLFSPLRIFLPVSMFLLILAMGFLGFDLIHENITDTTVLLFFTSILIFFFGLLADQISAIRREIK